MVFRLCNEDIFEEVWKFILGGEISLLVIGEMPTHFSFQSIRRLDDDVI